MAFAQMTFRSIAVLCCAAAALAAPAASAQTSLAAPIRLGVLPNVSARVLMTNYQPVRSFLEAELKGPVQVLTATDFRAFHAGTVKREYDFVVTAANLARVAEIDLRWQPMLVYEPGIPGVLVRSKSKPPAGIAALKSKRLALANPQSLVALRGFDWLAEQGLRRDVDYSTVVLRNDDSLFAALGDGEIPFALMSLGEFRAIPDPIRAGLEVETEFARVLGFVVMAAPDVPPARIESMRAALIKLMSTPEGSQFTALSGVRAIRAVLPADLATMDSFLRATRSGLTP